MNEDLAGNKFVDTTTTYGTPAPTAVNPQSLADKLKDLSLGLTTGRYGKIKVAEKLDSIAEELRQCVRP